MSPRWISTGEEVTPEDMPTVVFPVDPSRALPPSFGVRARAEGAQRRAHKQAVAKAFACGALSALTLVAIFAAAILAP